MKIKKYVVVGIVASVGISVATRIIVTKVVSPLISDIKLRVAQERADRAAQFEVWMNLFRQYVCGEPQPVDGPVAIEQDPLKLQQMKAEAIRRIEAHQRGNVDDLH